MYDIRYYDSTNAFARGCYLTNATTTNPIDDLVLYNNATQLARWKIQNGTQYLTGKIAGSPVGAIQYFVGNANWLVVILYFRGNKMKIIEEIMDEIIYECEKILKNTNYYTPNKQIINVILKEFSEIKNFYAINKKILLLSNKTWKLSSIRVIIDSADYSYDSLLFDKVRKFERLCLKLDSNMVKYRY